MENVEHCWGEPELTAIWPHMNRLSFMLKSWAESLAFISAVYARPLTEAISTPRVILYSLWAACRWCRVGPLLLWQTRSKLPCVVQLEPSPLWLPTLHFGSNPVLPFTYWGYLLSAWGCSTFSKCAFKIYDIWPQLSIHVDTHTLPQCSPASMGLVQTCPN